MGGKQKASLPNTFTRSLLFPSTPPQNPPSSLPSAIFLSNILTVFLYFRPLELRPNLQFIDLTVFQCFWQLELRPNLHLSTYLFCNLFVLSWFVSSQQQPISSTFHRVICNFWDRVLFQVFRSRSMLFPQPLHDTLLTTGFIGVSVIHQQSPFTPPPSIRPCVAHTLQSGFCSLRCVLTTFGLPTFNHDFHRCFMGLPAFLDAKRLSLGGACVSRAVREGSHTACCFWISVVFVYVFLFFWAYLFYFLHGHPCNRSVWVFVTQYTTQITFNGDPGFVASVPRVKGPASSEVLLPRTFILNFIFGLPSPILFYFVFDLLM